MIPIITLWSFRNERNELEARKGYYSGLNNNDYWITIGEIIGRYQ